MHTVFVNDAPLRFVNAYQAGELKGNSESIFVAEQEMKIEDALQELENTPRHPGFNYLASNPDVAWQNFISYCTLIEASGGLVQNEKGEYLIIFRKGRYDLPKGKNDYDESDEDCAIREVEEECGIGNVRILRPLEKTYHTYSEKGRRILKKSNWFLMQTHRQPLTPQAEEDIEKAEWMHPDNVRAIALKNTYASVGYLLKKFLP